MNSTRKLAIITGVLFIIGTAAGILSVIFFSPYADAVDYLINVAANVNQITWAALLQLIMGAACAGTAISMYPALKKFNSALAVGSVGFRLIEGALAILGFVFLLSLITLSREYVKAGMSNPQIFLSAGILLTAGRRWSSVAMLFSWCIGALMYYCLFYRTQLLPRWLSGWGIVGIILALAANLLDLFNIVNAFSPVNSALNFPIALQEMIMAGWLIIKGFNPNVLTVDSNNCC